MKKLLYVLLAVLVFLAVSSGVTKLMLMPQDVEFFGKYGFTNPILMAFGALQVLGGILLILPKARPIGAVFIAITFLGSAALLLMDGNFVVAAITVVVVAVLGFVVKGTAPSAIERING